MRIDSIAAAQSAPTTKDNQKLKQACQDFEAVFMGFMLKGMRKTVSKSEIDSSKEEEMFTDMMDDEICKSASKTSSIGIADMLYKQLSGDTRKETRGETR